MARKKKNSKWQGIPLNHTNIDEYMQDLRNETSGQYIAQAVSFNKDDNFQMNLLKNVLLSNGSFGGFVKQLLFTHFERNGKLEDSIWQPNETTVVQSNSPATQVTSQIAQEETQQVETPNPIVVQEQETASPPPTVENTPLINTSEETKTRPRRQAGLNDDMYKALDER